MALLLASKVRVISIAVLRRGEEILVSPVWDHANQVKGWRPLGGGIEPSETAEAALHRELREEIGATVSDVKQIAVLENIFRDDSSSGHEIVFVFEAQLQEQAMLECDALPMNENGDEMMAHWVSIRSFRSGENRLFPEALVDLI